MKTRKPPHDAVHTRRRVLRAAAIGAAGFLTPRWLGARVPNVQSNAARAAGEFTVAHIDRVTVRVPYRDAPRRAMDRELPHWRYSEIFEVRLRSGKVGIGETLLYYTWGVSSDDDVKRALGGNAVELMWDDRLGAGLQMALFDAVAKAAGVPVYRLLGSKTHDTTPLSWWNIDMHPEDMASECAEALRAGYLSYKTKGRPWFDLWDQVEQSVKVVPESFKIDMDFNDTLLDAKRAIPILKDLERHPQIDIYETPIPQGDVAGNKAIREATRVKIAMHYGNPSPSVVVREGVCDGFVVGGGATRVMRSGAFAGQVGMPFWLQLVGTGITAAFSLHFGAVLKQARWPAVNCHQLYTHDLLAKPIVIEKGHARVPDAPGLGYELDREAIAKFKVDKPASRPDPKRILETSWPDGRTMYVANNGVNFILRQGMRGVIPFYERGVTTRLLSNDGSAEWSELWERAREKPVFVGGKR